MIDDASLERLSGLFAEERAEARAAADRLVEDLRAGREASFPERFGKYGLIRELGRGGLGRVWLAWDPELRRLVALKTLSAGGEASVRRLMREARLAAALTHPRIAQVHEVGEAHGVSFIAMQYLEGRSLEGERLDPAEAARVVRDAARILHWAHGRGIVHRDVKPGNLMRCGPDGDVYVVDFGLARPTAGEASLSAVSGTPAYMSPEQAAGETVGPEADVYSRGAPRRRLAPPPLPPDLERAIRKATDVKTHRPRSAEAFAEDLDRVLRGERVRARRRPGPVLKGLLAASLLAVLALLIGRARETPPGPEARLEESLRLVERARALIEESRVNLYRRGATLSETFLKDLDRAAESVRRSLEVAERAEARLLLGRIAMLLGDYAGARREFDRAIELSPRRPVDGLLGRARAYVEEAAEELFAGREEEGGFLLASAKEIFDRLPGLSRRLKEGAIESELIEAWRLAASGEFDAAVVYATERAGKAEEFHLAAGLAHFRLGQGRAAVRSLTQAIEVRPNYYQAHLWRGLMLDRLGNREYALREIDRALEIHPRYVRAREARAELGD
jgi:tetratricopeptide (TPR) repeat protein/predicted Ser/Thr protein kinase